MSQEIRNLLEENPKQTSREILEQLQARHPGQTINKNSCNVAFSHARRRLGIRGESKRSVKMKRPTTRVARTTSASTESVDITLLKAARKFLADAGSSAAAISAIQQVEALQLS